MTTATTFVRPYCGRELRWVVLQDEAAPEKVDVLLQSDPGFSPLADALASPTPSAAQQQLLALLDGWGSGSGASAQAAAAAVEGLVGVLLALYPEHHKARISECVTDERVLFEVSMLEGLGCTEVLLVTGRDGAPQQACFTLPVPVDLAPARQLLECMQRQGGAPQQQGGEQLQQQPPPPPQEERFALTVSFPLARPASQAGGGGGGGGGGAIPALQLHAPGWFAPQLPGMPLPTWDAHTSLLEFLPHLAERIERHLTECCPVAVQRYSLLEGLAGLLGPPLELNMAPAGGGSTPSTSASTSSSSSWSAVLSGGGLTTSSAEGTAAAAARALFHVQWEQQQPLLLFVLLPQNYPSEPPELSLQNVRRLGPGARVRLQDLPWSPRWPVDEQVARLFNALKQRAGQAGNAAEASAGIGGSNGTATTTSTSSGLGAAAAAAPPPAPPVAAESFEPTVAAVPDSAPSLPHV